MGRVVTVVGASRSGLAVARLLLQHGAQVRVTESVDTPGVRVQLAQLERRETLGQLRVEVGRHTREMVAESSLVVTSPGVHADARPLQWARDCGIPIVSEIELASWFCAARIIAVTGTNGKSTATTMITELIKASGRHAIACGNIGHPFADVVPVLGADDYAVVEVSSFQLEHCRTFRPKIAVLLNISPNHLDHHASFDEYIESKYRLFAQQTDMDQAVLNIDDGYSVGAADRTCASTHWFSGQGHATRHAAYRVGELLGIPDPVMQHTLNAFPGLPHRQEYICTDAMRVRYINDSKSTTPASMQWALQTVEGPLVLIAGGKNKALDFHPVVSTIARLNHDTSLRQPYVRQLVALGECRSYLRELFAPLIPVREAQTLADAVRLASQCAQPGDTVLFSPGCASFDMFQNFEDRGGQFASCAQAIADGISTSVHVPHIMPFRSEITAVEPSHSAMRRSVPAVVR